MTPGTTYTADYSDYNLGPPQVSGQHFGHHLPVDYTVITQPAWRWCPPSSTPLTCSTLCPSNIVSSPLASPRSSSSTATWRCLSLLLPQLLVQDTDPKQLPTNQRKVTKQLSKSAEAIYFTKKLRVPTLFKTYPVPESAWLTAARDLPPTSVDSGGGGYFQRNLKLV